MAMSAITTLPVRRWPERRRLVLLTAAALFVAVFVARELSDSDADAIALLYVVPIALVALELGLLAGLASALLAVGLLGVWLLDSDVSLGAAGILIRAVTFVTVGAVAGRFGDRMRDAQRRQQLLLSSGLALADLEVADELPAMLARRALDLTAAQAARADLISGGSAEIGEFADDRVRLRLPIDVRGEPYGTLAVSGARALSPEDRASLQILALQAAVAIESRRLLDAQRESALIGAELEDARAHLAERAAQLRELIARQEAERHHVAHELHEEAAQMLAAALLSLGALERELGASLPEPRLGELRSGIDSTLRSLRALAASLRPPALQLGLRAALEQLGADAHARGFGEVQIALDGIHGLSEETETMVYRVVQEALDAVGSAGSVSIAGHGGQIDIEVQGARTPIDPARLSVLKARMELAGGTLTGGSAGVRAEIPLVLARPSSKAA